MDQRADNVSYLVPPIPALITYVQPVDIDNPVPQTDRRGAQIRREEGVLAQHLHVEAEDQTGMSCRVRFTKISYLQVLLWDIVLG